MNTSKFSALALPTSPGGANWAGHGPPSRNILELPSRRRAPKPSSTPRARACSVSRMGSCKVCVYSERVVASAAFTFTLAAFTRCGGSARASERANEDRRARGCLLTSRSSTRRCMRVSRQSTPISQGRTPPQKPRRHNSRVARGAAETVSLSRPRPSELCPQLPKSPHRY